MEGYTHSVQVVLVRLSMAAVLSAFLLLGLPLLASAADLEECVSNPSVVINEVMWMGSAVSSSDEWIELYNTADEDIDISGWVLENAAAKSAPLLLLPDGTTIAADGYLVIANFAEDDSRSAFGVADIVMSSISLTNTGNGDLILRDSVGKREDCALATAGDSDTRWPAPSSSSITKSMERVSPAGNGLLATQWHVSTRSLDGEHYGTPGEANSEPAINEPPEAAVAGLTEAAVGETVEFTAEDSADPDDDALTFAWSFGDGATAAGVTAAHTYTAAGTYTVRLTVSDGELEAAAELSVTIAAPVYSTALVINEVLPNPVGSDSAGEFVELHNTSSEAVDMTGWQLDDAEGGSSPHTIGAGISMAAGGYRTFMRSETRLALNNTGDSVRLFDPAGGEKGSITYSGGAEGQSYARTGGGTYAWSTTVTAGAANVITVPEADDAAADEEEAGAAGSVAGSQAVVVPLADVREEEPGTTVTVTGVVSAPPGSLGKYVMYVAGSGIQTYLSREAWPGLQLGDTVELTGELSSIRGEARIKLASAADVRVVAGGPPPEPHLVATGDIDEALEGWLVTVQGEVVETSGDTFYVDDGSGQAKVYITASSGIDKPAMKKGTAVTITGVVSETTSGYRILPRFQEDVRLGRVAGLKSFPATGLRPASGRGSARQAGLFLGAALLLLRWGYLAKEPLCAGRRGV